MASAAQLWTLYKQKVQDIKRREKGFTINQERCETAEPADQPALLEQALTIRHEITAMEGEAAALVEQLLLLWLQEGAVVVPAPAAAATQAAAVTAATQAAAAVVPAPAAAAAAVVPAPPAAAGRKIITQARIDADRERVRRDTAHFNQWLQGATGGEKQALLRSLEALKQQQQVLAQMEQFLMQQQAGTAVVPAATTAATQAAAAGGRKYSAAQLNARYHEKKQEIKRKEEDWKINRQEWRAAQPADKQAVLDRALEIRSEIAALQGEATMLLEWMVLVQRQERAAAAAAGAAAAAATILAPAAAQLRAVYKGVTQSIKRREEDWTITQEQWRAAEPADKPALQQHAMAKRQVIAALQTVATAVHKERLLLEQKAEAAATQAAAAAAVLPAPAAAAVPATAAADVSCTDKVKESLKKWWQEMRRPWHLAGPALPARGLLSKKVTRTGVYEPLLKKSKDVE